MDKFIRYSVYNTWLKEIVLTKDSINSLVICYATHVFYLYVDVP